MSPTHSNGSIAAFRERLHRGWSCNLRPVCKIINTQSYQRAPSRTVQLRPWWKQQAMTVESLTTMQQE
jgi:hypothetical protein